MAVPNPSLDSGHEVEDLRIGVYVCHCGGNISDVVNVEKVAEAAGRLPSVAVAKLNTFMCSDPGQQMITDDIRNERLNRVVVAACSPSLHELTFRRTLARAGLNPYLFEHANIREQVSWVGKSDPQSATNKAIRLVGAAVAKARQLQSLEPIRVEADPHVVVIGGGVSGLRSATDLSRRGFPVILLEQASFLGGHLTQLDRTYPTEVRARDLLRGLTDAVREDLRVAVYTSAEVTAISGYVGNFSLKVRLHAHGAVEEQPEEIELTAAAIVLATGFDSYEPRQGEYGFQDHPCVITLPQLVRLLDPEGPTNGELRLSGLPVRNVCLIHCVGSRQVEGLHEPGPDGRINDYCSRFCCTAALRAANEIRERFPDVDVFDFYQDIRTYGRGHEDYYEEASRRGVLFFRFTAEAPPVVEAVSHAGFPLNVKVKDTLTWGEELDVPTDMVVLVTGMIPHKIDRLMEELKLPRSADGFLQEVHPKLRPVEMAVNGVFLAGTCQAPMDITESCNASAAAAAKASALVSKGYIELAPFVAKVDADRCQGHGACVEECAYQNAISLVETTVNGTRVKRAEVNPAVCKGCGMCVPVCPENAIQVEGCRVDQFEAMVDAIVADY